MSDQEYTPGNRQQDNVEPVSVTGETHKLEDTGTEAYATTPPISDEPGATYETPTVSEQSVVDGSGNQARDSNDLVGELREMGSQIEAVLRAAVESDRAKQIQKDLAGGVRELTSQVQQALRSLQTNPRVQQAEERGRQAFSQAQQSKFAADVQDALITGLGQINTQLQKVVARMEQDRANRMSQDTSADSQTLLVDSEPATDSTFTTADYTDTNETRRLDNE